MIEIRPFQQDDWHVLLDLANQAVPFAPQENIEWLAYRKAFDESKRIRRHYLAFDSGTPVGYGCLEQQSESLDSLRIYVVADPVNLRGEVGKLLYTQLLYDAQELKATVLWARELQDDEPIRDFFTGYGFEEVQRFTVDNHLPMVVFTLNLVQ
jgi:N-acetylglutamate synthase-like GNAT family acetyltransferase